VLPGLSSPHGQAQGLALAAAFVALAWGVRRSCRLRPVFAARALLVAGAVALLAADAQVQASWRDALAWGPRYDRYLRQRHVLLAAAAARGERVVTVPSPPWDSLPSTIHFLDIGPVAESWPNDAVAAFWGLRELRKGLSGAPRSSGSPAP
jgi:hypothetical protein